jgi:hypothetical protein
MWLAGLLVLVVVVVVGATAQLLQVEWMPLEMMMGLL